MPSLTKGRRTVPVQTQLMQLSTNPAQIPDAQAVLGAHDQFRAVRSKSGRVGALLRVFQPGELAASL